MTSVHIQVYRKNCCM